MDGSLAAALPAAVFPEWAFAHRCCADQRNLLDNRRLISCVCPRQAMAQYYANSDAMANGDHEVHAWGWGCICRPRNDDCLYLGEFPNCADAVAEANPQSKASYWCSS